MLKASVCITYGEKFIYITGFCELCGIEIELHYLICKIGDQDVIADKKNFRTYTFYLTNPIGLFFYGFY